MIGLYKDPHGENIFQNNTSVFSNPTLSTVRDGDFKTSDNNVLELQTRIKELEEEVKVHSYPLP